MGTRRLRRVLRWKIQIIIKKKHTLKYVDTHLPWKRWKQHQHESCWNWVGTERFGGSWLPAWAEREPLSVLMGRSTGTAPRDRRGPGRITTDAASGEGTAGRYEAKCACPQLLCCQQWLFCLVVSCFLIDQVNLQPPGIYAAATGLCVSEFLWEA